MPRPTDLAIFVLTDRQTEPIALPLVHAHGIITCTYQIITIHGATCEQAIQYCTYLDK